VRGGRGRGERGGSEGKASRAKKCFPKAWIRPTRFEAPALEKEGGLSRAELRAEEEEDCWWTCSAA